MMLHTLDPLTLPLSGLQMIEASAGTGKTFTLAALYVRLVLGHALGSRLLGAGLCPPQILVMTFTDAATAELRQRIRERLAQAAHFFQTGEADTADDFLLALRAQIDAEQWPLCAWRLDMAAQWMDEAAIFTIHGWSSRMLKTHAFDSASLFTQTRVEEAERLQLRAAQDYWRQWFYALDAQALGALKALGDTPQALLARLQVRWKSSERAPQPDTPEPVAPDLLLARWLAWQQQRASLETLARQAWRDDVIRALQAAAATRTLKGYRADWLAGWLAKMTDWVQGGELDPDVLVRFSRATLLAKGWADAERWPVLVDLEALHAHLLVEPAVADAVLSHAAQAVLRAYQRAKARAAQFDFSDLLQNLYHALQAPDGRLAAAIAAQYPVALVDEFQDTDPWQFGALSRIYSCKPNTDMRYRHISNEILADQGFATTGQAALGLIMIGDPKQAIYSFRGADLATYLQAREQAQGIYTLPGNYRATAALVTAVSRVFAQADAPFGSVPFVPVKACNQQVRPLQVNGLAQVAMTVWHVPFEKTPTRDDFLQALSAVFASQMVTLLQSTAARPGDMAVLVRDRHEASAIRAALSQRSVRSVYLSERNSVYASQQADDLWRILRAVAQPGANRLLRAALATPTWALSWEVLDAQLADEAGWDAQVEQFMQWQRVWQEQGLLPMLYRLLHDQGLAARLLQRGSQGERELTNLLHLGELLQAASLELQGEGALVRYLDLQLRHPQASGDAAQLRLESDAQLVQVVTVHKSKGLEYPLVFLPFVSLYRSEDKDADRPDAERLAEDIRLLYVALTRARQALWMGVAQVRGDVDGPSPQPKSAVSRLLGRSVAGDLWQRLQTWVCADLQVQTAPPPDHSCYQPRHTLTPTPQLARQPQRQLTQRWWSASFSALTRGLLPHGAADLLTERDEKLGDAQLDAATPEQLPFAAAGHEPDVPPTDLLTDQPPYNDFPAGSRYGTLLHDLLEWQAAHGWPEAVADPDPTLKKSWAALLARLGERLGLAPQHSALLEPWIRSIVVSKMPLANVDKSFSAIQLGSIQATDCWPEMAFTLPVQTLASQRLDQLIGQHMWPGQARATLPRQTLEGMLTGFMDLVLLQQGRYYVLDYKSNRLPDYSPSSLRQAMLTHRYDVQAALYVLALHRLLRARLGSGYDYEQHMGGALYLFLRGIGQPGAGLLQLQAPRALIEAMDQAFGATAQRGLV